MADPHDDISMLLRGYGDRVLATKHIAIVMAEMLIVDDVGEVELEFQKPLEITELYDRWLIEGRDEFMPHPRIPDGSLSGRITIEILKRNCRVIKYIQSYTY